MKNRLLDALAWLAVFLGLGIMLAALCWQGYVEYQKYAYRKAVIELSKHK